MKKLSSLRNIGKELERKLKEVGINSAEELCSVGPKMAFVKLKMRFPEVCLVHLYSLQGAIDGVDFNSLSEDVKRDLKSFSDSLKEYAKCEGDL